MSFLRLVLLTLAGCAIELAVIVGVSLVAFAISDAIARRR